MDPALRTCPNGPSWKVAQFVLLQLSATGRFTAGLRGFRREAHHGASPLTTSLLREEPPLFGHLVPPLHVLSLVLEAILKELIFAVQAFRVV